MFETRITRMFGIQYPIIQGGMQWLSTAEFVAAVSNAGGLGIITSAAYPTVKELRAEIKKAKSLTDKPIGVNINLLPTTRPLDTEGYIDTAIEEGIDIVETVGRSPEPYIKRLKEGGVKVMHKVARVRDAMAAERLGVDAVCIVGFEGAGHLGMDDVTSLIRIPLTVDAVKIPVVAAGGIGDARGFVAALALGAEGVVMGTRFMATRECPLHPEVKQWMLQAKETDTMVIQRSIRNACRYARNEVAERVLGMETMGATLEELLSVIGGERGKRAMLEGNLGAGLMCCGQVVGLVKELLSVKEVIQGVIEGAKAIVERLYSMSSYMRTT